METLVVVDQHRNQCYGKFKAYKPARIGSSPSGHFREINCRSFQSSAGLLPTPCCPAYTTPVKKTSPNTAFSSSFSSQKTFSPATKAQGLRSSPLPINIPAKATHFEDELVILNENSLFSELWAGPAYSNSPPPSSLPMPKFSMKPKRTVSLDLPASDSDFKLLPTAKSAPASPTREYNSSTRVLFHSVDSATMMLRRILNLDLGDEEI